MRYVLADRAIADLQDIHRYGSQEFGDDLADLYFIDIMDRVDSIVSHPKIGKQIEFNDMENLRKLGARQHLIIYTIKDTSVEIRRVIHASVDLKRALKVT